MALRFSFDSDSDDDLGDAMSMAGLFAMLGRLSSQSQQAVEESPLVLNIQSTCRLIDQLVDVALENLDSQAKASDNDEEKASLNQTLGMLLVMGRSLQNALKEFSEHVAHKVCGVKDHAADVAGQTMGQLGEWVERSPVLASSDDVKAIEKAYQKLVSDCTSYNREQSLKQPQSRPAAGSSANIMQMLFNSIPNQTSARSAQSFFGPDFMAQQQANERAAFESALGRSSSSSNLDGVGRLFASPVRERETAQRASPSHSPSSLRR